jgi:hypothetical protein
MKTIQIIEDATLEDWTATLSATTWDYVEKLKMASAFSQKGSEIFVGDVFQGPQFLMRIVDEDHPDDMLCVSTRVKRTFYPDILNITLGVN